jgi:hypothetical protein
MKTSYLEISHIEMTQSLDVKATTARQISKQGRAAKTENIIWQDLGLQVASAKAQQSVRFLRMQRHH